MTMADGVPHQAHPPETIPPETIVVRSGRAQAAWLMAASILVQALWNPLLLVTVLALLDDGPSDLAAPISYGAILLVVVLVGVIVTVLYAVVKPDDIKLDATGWSTGRRDRWRHLSLPPATAIDPMWSPVHGWRVRARFVGLKRLHLHSPWTPPWRKRDAAFRDELHTIRAVAERHGARLRPLRHRVSWWPVVGSLVIVATLAGFGYAGVRDGVVWPWVATVDRTLNACQTLDAAQLAKHWPEAERKRQDAGADRDDTYANVSRCAWAARDESPLSKVSLLMTRNKSGLAGSGIAAAVTDVRRDHQVWVDYQQTYGKSREVDGIGDEAYVLRDAAGEEANLTFHVANVSVELTVRAQADGQPVEQVALALGRGVADQLRAMRS